MVSHLAKTTMKDTSLITWGDFTDLYYKAKFKGTRFIMSRLFKVSLESRVLPNGTFTPRFLISGSSPKSRKRGTAKSRAMKIHFTKIISGTNI
jgi:hypothetical protein